MRVARTLLVALGLLLTAAPAVAGPFELHADLRVGAATGKGIGGDQKDRDFFAQSDGGVYGVLVGARLLFIEVSIEHDQFTDFKDLKGTWSELKVGTGGSIALDAPLRGQDSALFLSFGFGVGFGVGTGRQVDPPLDNAQISDKGLMLNVRVGLEYRLGGFFALGVEVPAGWGYMWKNDVPVNDTSNHYQTFHVMGLAFVRARVGL
jgi:hypothetical protein